jgi:hypothetical protein
MTISTCLKRFVFSVLPLVLLTCVCFFEGRADNPPTMYAPGPLPIGTSTGYGVVKADGTTITSASGVITTAALPGNLVGTTPAVGYAGYETNSVVNSSGGIAITTGATSNVTSIVVPPGNYTVSGHVTFNGTSATVTQETAGISTNSATLPTADSSQSTAYPGTTTTTGNTTCSLESQPINCTTNTTIYLVGKPAFSAGSMSLSGALHIMQTP